MKKENKKRIFVAKVLLFVAYLLLLCYFLFFAESMGRTFSQRQYHYNLEPLKEIKRFWQYRHSLGIMSVALNLAGNVIVFIPLGAFLPGLCIRCRRMWATLLLCFEFSLCVEVVQLVCKVGSFDVDDILLNTLGGLIGYILYLVYRWIRRDK